MKNFDIYARNDGQRRAVKKGWSWPAFFFGSIWAICMRLWLIGLLLLPAELFLNIAISVFEKTQSAVSSNHANTVNIIGSLIALLALSIRIAFGAYGNSWKRRRLENNGFKFVSTINAESKKKPLSLQQTPSNDTKINTAHDIDSLIEKLGIDRAGEIIRHLAQNGNLTCQIFLSTAGLKIPEQYRTLEINQDIELYTKLAAQGGDATAKLNLALIYKNKTNTATNANPEQNTKLSGQAKNQNNDTLSQHSTSSKMKMLSFEQFANDFGRGAKQTMNMSIYHGYFDCSCGEFHWFNDSIEVICQGRGMKIMTICPKNPRYLTSVKIKTFMVLKFKGFQSLVGTQLVTEEQIVSAQVMKRIFST